MEINLSLSLSLSLSPSLSLSLPLSLSLSLSLSSLSQIMVELSNQFVEVFVMGVSLLLDDISGSCLTG